MIDGRSQNSHFVSSHAGLMKQRESNQEKDLDLLIQDKLVVSSKEVTLSQPDKMVINEDSRLQNHDIQYSHPASLKSVPLVNGE